MIHCVYTVNLNYDGEKYLTTGVNVTTMGYGDPFCAGCVAVPGLGSAFVEYTNAAVNKLGYVSKHLISSQITVRINRFVLLLDD
jgi:hypothetical protein